MNAYEGGKAMNERDQDADLERAARDAEEFERRELADADVNQRTLAAEDERALRDRDDRELRDRQDRDVQSRRDDQDRHNRDQDAQRRKNSQTVDAYLKKPLDERVREDLAVMSQELQRERDDVAVRPFGTAPAAGHFVDGPDRLASAEWETGISAALEASGMHMRTRDDVAATIEQGRIQNGTAGRRGRDINFTDAEDRDPGELVRTDYGYRAPQSDERREDLRPDRGPEPNDEMPAGGPTGPKVSDPDDRFATIRARIDANEAYERSREALEAKEHDADGFSRDRTR